MGMVSKNEIIKILLKYQREIDSVQNKAITSDNFNKVADEIVKLFNINNKYSK